MEKEALRRGLDLLDSNHLKVDYIVTNCNAQVQEYLKERKITQYYDVFHFEKGNYLNCQSFITLNYYFKSFALLFIKTLILLRFIKNTENSGKEKDI